MNTFLFEVLPTILTLLFVLFFLGMLIFVITDRRRQHHERMAAMALDDAPAPDEERTHG